LAYIVEQAGGLASDGRTRALGVKPASVHQRIPCYMGSKLDVQEVEALFKEFDEAQAATASS
jgi:fructose-1,6-bisphosphatase I